jgi:hypothetical protein
MLVIRSPTLTKKPVPWNPAAGVEENGMARVTPRPARRDVTYYDVKFARRVARARVRLGYSMRELAEIADVHNSQIVRLERLADDDLDEDARAGGVSMSAAMRIAKALGLRMDPIAQLDGKPKHKKRAG